MCGCERHEDNDEPCNCFCEHDGVIDGRKSSVRRSNCEAYRGYGTGFREYRKTSTIFATKQDRPFKVHTLEGLHEGKAGDFLAVGIHGELYPIDAAVMEASYEEVLNA